MPLKILVSPNAFKGTLSPPRAAAAITAGLAASHPNALIVSRPLADGGDGTLDVLVPKMNRRRTTVRGPLGAPVRAEWGLFDQNGVRTAVIEMARASGLALVKGRNRILDASSRGTGELIRAALDAGARRIVIGAGGTATADGGAGALEALGLRFYGGGDRPLRAAPRALIALRRVDRSRLDGRLRRTAVSILCDVTNPLLGARGSARTFGPQKGATPAQVALLERLMRRWSTFATVQTRNRPGAGAAGALAFGLSAFAGGRLVGGGEFIINELNWRRVARSVDWIVTGEGRLDETSFSGKVVGAVAAGKGRARLAVVCGTSALGARAWTSRGISAVEWTGPGGLRRPEAAVRQAAARLRLG